MLESELDILWVLWAAALVFVMQAGFLCLEAGVTRTKNAINVAMKNLADFAVALLVFWVLGFGLMFGRGISGWWGGEHFLLQLEAGDAVLATLFLFQAMFCATAATVVSGAVAERMSFVGYLAVTVIVSLLIYPLFGHWAWGGLLGGVPGWLAGLGFVDFAGATVVHSVGGWVALAAILLIGPRRGRFVPGEAPRTLPAGNLPMAMLGVLLLFLGWFGFNGGSTLAFDGRVPGVLVNTVLAAVAGVLSGMLIGWRVRRYADVMYAMNGAIAGLVAVTAGAHALSMGQALAVGAIGGVLMVLASEWLLRRGIDDAVGAVPAHLVAGIWGTLAVGLLGDMSLLDTGLGRVEQLLVQALGVVVCGIWSFGLAWLLLRGIDRLRPLRVSDEAERLGLNMAEHGARTELNELLECMREHERRGDLQGRVEADPFTEVGEIAAGYNRVAGALERAVANTQVMLRNLRDGVVTWRADGTLTGLNPGAEQLFGVEAKTLLGAPISQLIADELPALGERRELRLRGADGIRYLEIQVSEGAAGSHAEFAGMVRDITERKRLEEQLYRERDLAQVTLASIGDGVITTDASGCVTFLNAEASRLTGWSLEAAYGQPIAHIYQLLDETHGGRVDNPARRVLASGRAVAADAAHLLLGAAGERWPVHHSAAPIRSRQGLTVGAVVVFQDVTVNRSLARKLSHQASHDALTGLANRRAFEAQLQQLVASVGEQHVLCYLDLDQFKVVNDTCGHMAGDELLRQVSRLLRQHLRGTDLLARLGGDEFGILLFDCPAGKAVELGEELRRSIETFRFGWEGHSFAIGVSIGMVPLGEGHALTLRDALSAADAACYAAKEGGRNRVHLYQPDDSQLLERHGELQWVPRLQAALDADALRLYVQPIVAIDKAAGGAIHEVLVRLEEGGKIISPGAFLPAAERYNLMPRIDRWVVRNTLAWLGDTYRSGELEGMWSINLSGASLSDPQFCRVLEEQVAAAALPAGTLCFEITESAAIAQLSTVSELIVTLKALGCRFALDDFGAGLSSFGYLKQLPVDFLKIDGHFVRDLHRDSIDRAMVEAINTVGHTLGLLTIAEFVEDEDVLQRLRELGVDYAQGYLFGKPQPVTTLVHADVMIMPR
ncbi:ammonium transporter [Halomonas salipaludis]|uniref:Ammonia permease n=1 Tax=Halomonas salipaludis TaxID=2032625 RepID=A0A2A2EWZ5_9GAMM|nr:ammonium transporter [Halomonas salipaludis]PAU76899.1 ammonia permease [Halomonas salipaludis]